ncbi:preprotein translocase subunit SecA [Aminiphilus circumscriptus]|jgi:preprotein translocase subunit SecA|uniref:preprotein translocase subunit SecA n=1 Tax=Aminiphilus circumscriptus TaxID=290732 RepID=UPI000492C1A3|nr:preprotein translocase subunit SecA [Aminiphilus circumscriptus]
MLDSLKRALGLDPNERALRRYRQRVVRINELEAALRSLNDEELAGRYDALRKQVLEGTPEDEILEDVFAVVREVAVRTLGMRHFDVQLMGGMALSEGKIAEMKTGEGKTLVATLAVVLGAASGKGVHVVTVNDYLAKRDAEWMGPIYRFLGLSVGVLYPYMPQEERLEAYRADVTYGTNSEFGFDYLRDNMAVHPSQLVQRGHAFAIVDEVDSILIDEARTPLIISGPSEDATEPYVVADRAARKLQKGADFEIDEKERNLALTEEGIARAEQILGHAGLFSDWQHSEMAHKLVQALKAIHLFQRDVHYVVKDGEIVIVDEFTGRLMFGRRYSDGLHQAIEAKERVRIGRENQTLATITLQNYFRMYRKLAGMTGTAATEAEEFKEIYGLPVIVLPTNRPLVREDFSDAIFRTKREKFLAAAEEVAECHAKGQPVLVGTTSIENSEVMSKLLKARKIPHEVLNAKYHEKEAQIVAQAGRFGAVTVATNMAGRGTDIVLGGNPEFLARDEARLRGVDPVADPESFAVIREEMVAQCAAEREKVLAAGGLHILGTERHESRRIDNQLRGRGGRQGDPGTSRFYLALEDDLLRLFGSERIQGIMEKLGMEEGEAIEHSLLTKAIENAQRKVEQYHFDIRRQLLMYDNVMNQQREAVYGERRSILAAEDGIVEHAWEIVEDTLANIIDTAFPEGDAEPDTNAAAVRLKAVFGPGAETFIEGVASRAEALDARDKLARHLRERFDEKVKQLGGNMAADLFRFVVLHVLDSRWKEHLLGMDELRRGIGLRAIGQKDPLLEYQFESYNLFQEMLGRVRESVAELVFRVSVVAEGAAPGGGRSGSVRPGAVTPVPVLLGASREETPGSGGERVPLRKGERVGRNDPCPCGSGKKYKHCCGRVS